MYVIAIVGAGGKTSRIKNLTREYVQQGKNVLVTTTTQKICNISDSNWKNSMFVSVEVR